MHLITMAAAVAAAATAGSAPAEAPQWARRPVVDEADYPPRARRDEQSGIAVVKCDVSAKGVLENCATLYEAPEGYGFGDSAVRAVKRSRIKLPSGRPMEGSAVSVPLKFDSNLGLMLARYEGVRTCYGALASVGEGTRPAPLETSEALLFATAVKVELAKLNARPEVMEMDLAEARRTGNADPALRERCLKAAADAFAAAAKTP